MINTIKQSYKGTRDFFPEETRFRNYLFEIQRNICKLYGYKEYAAPLLELVDLYRNKSSSEIVNEQIYSFEDRGGREVAIRPEMTPSLARMIKIRQRELSKPIRWFSIANFMRYERPGHGRLREFFQLNVDLFGSSGVSANAEVLSLAIDILLAYGAKPKEFIIRYSDRRLLYSYLNQGKLAEVKNLDDPKKTEHLRQISRVLDKRDKLSPTEFENMLKEHCSNSKEMEQVQSFFSLSKADIQSLASKKGQIDPTATAELFELENILGEQFPNHSFIFDPSLSRGFDYYTSFIFEIYDSDPKNKRSLFGGGRYDHLLEVFGGTAMPAVGFGLGDLTLENFLRSHNHIPNHINEAKGIFLALHNDNLKKDCRHLAQNLRRAGIPVEQSLESSSKFGRQFEIAQKKNMRFVIILGEEELSKKIIKVKDLLSGKQEAVPHKDIINYFKKYYET